MSTFVVGGGTFLYFNEFCYFPFKAKHVCVQEMFVGHDIGNTTPDDTNIKMQTL